MFSICSPQPRKRDREDDDYISSGFGEHRVKRHMSTLPLRQSPSRHHTLPSLATSSFFPLPGPSTITPVNSDSEESPIRATRDEIPGTADSSWQASPTTPMVVLVRAEDENDEEMEDDYDMTDSDTVHLSPGPFQSDPATSISGRIPTPIHTQFASNIRRGPFGPSKPPPQLNLQQPTALFQLQDRRLPSPISEGENSPSVILSSLGNMQMQVPMEVEEDEYNSQTISSSSRQAAPTHETGSMQPPPISSPPKRGHTRSKHSLRSWGGGDMLPTGEETGRKSFSIGYRADCEKCRNKVPGHFSHIITQT